MKIKSLIAMSLIAAILVSLAPTPRALADGAASTRNILLGVGAAAATLIIINHNKKVHEKYAEDARAEAALASQRDDARTAYQAEVRAYDNQVAVTRELKKEVSVKDSMISQLRGQLAQMGVQTQIAKPGPAAMAAAHSVQIVSYGWGTL